MTELQLFRRKTLKIAPSDNVAVALVDLMQGETVELGSQACRLATSIPSKHKFALQNLSAGENLVMYGVVVGEALQNVAEGELVTTSNVRHKAATYRGKRESCRWVPPDISKWKERRFQGFRRADGQVGTRNYWLVVPLVFCENRNIRALEQAFEKELGILPPDLYHRHVAELARLYKAGRVEEIQSFPFPQGNTPARAEKLFANVDGVRFLTHGMGCGGTRDDARALCGLLAGYIHHPNVAGATILSLGCQHAQIAMLREEVQKRDANFEKPLLVFDQQQSQLESAMLTEAIRQTFVGLTRANELARSPQPLSSLTLGLKCGGSDGFSGISANPAIGHASDVLCALGGKTILAEFPELCGVEQNLIDRCVTVEAAERFANLMQTYAARAEAIGSGFDMNPSPGNIKDGLITDGIKSAGAARKGGSSPIADVLDYPEYATKPGLNLLCTPGNDVEAVSAQVGAGANVVVFTTGLGTPTGNPVAPVMKISTNSDLARRMSDIIDLDTGAIVRGEATIEAMGETVLEEVLRVASGEIPTKAELKNQVDFIPWKRGVSL